MYAGERFFRPSSHSERRGLGSFPLEVLTVIAPVGQVDSHAPQVMHTGEYSLKGVPTLRFLPRPIKLMAPTFILSLHIRTQIPQRTQSSSFLIKGVSVTPIFAHSSLTILLLLQRARRSSATPRPGSRLSSTLPRAAIKTEGLPSEMFQ